MSFTFTGTITGMADLARGLDAAEQVTLRAVDRAMKRTALGGQSIVRGKASGRPGPRNITGDYRRSIVGQALQVDRAVFHAIIGSNAPQALRLEFGFVGPDALGRVYNQPPFPHFGPSVGEIGDLAQNEVRFAVGGAF